MIKPFVEQLPEKKLHRRSLKTLQVNIGKLCNLSCRHCHVGSGPNKTRENMTRETVERVIELLQQSNHIEILDITGGAPELNPHFCYLVEQASLAGKEVWDRCNLTVLFESGQERMIEFLAHHKVRIIASLPCYTSANVEKQRGDGVFMQSIKALQNLNAIGYGKDGSDLFIDLVYNPVGPHLPPAQEKLKQDYDKRLFDDFGIVFNNLYTITNMPIKRFLVDLKRSNQEDTYMQLLADNFNSNAAQNVMCRDLISVSWDGYLYDCDFNQALDLSIPPRKTSIFNINSFDDFIHHPINLKDHCYGCTAGSGSSCGGSLV